jgi:hypothetical protein
MSMMRYFKTESPSLFHAACMQIAEKLINEAIEQLDGFEPERSAPLVALAKFIGYRQN